MNRHFAWIMALVMAVGQHVSAADKLNVVATTADFGAIAREIGGDLVDVTVLAQPGEDVHFVSPKPSHIVKLSRADVIIEGGAELEIGWLPPLIDGARNPKLAVGQPGHVACAEGLSLLEVPHTMDRSRGDIHGMGNPHFMTDPVCAKHAAGNICGAFTAVDPDHAGIYEERLADFRKRIEDKLASWQAQLAPYSGKHIVAFHNSWPYFANRFGLKINTFLEPKPGIPPSPAHLARVVSAMKAEQIRVIVVEPYQNRKTAETVATKTGAVIVDFTQYPGGVKGSGTGYIELLDYLVDSLASALGNSASEVQDK